MQWIQVACVIGIQLLIGVFVYGRLVERVKEHSGKILHLENQSDSHERRLSYFEGYQAGRKSMNGGDLRGDPRM